MNDPTETIRQNMVAEINIEPGSREYLEAKYGKVWTTKELQQDFEVLSFSAPMVVVRQKSDGVKGTLIFQYNPRFYFDFSPE